MSEEQPTKEALEAARRLLVPTDDTGEISIKLFARALDAFAADAEQRGAQRERARIDKALENKARYFQKQHNALEPIEENVRVARSINAKIGAIEYIRVEIVSAQMDKGGEE